MYRAVRFSIALVFLAPVLAFAQFSTSSSANPAQTGTAITFTVQDVTGYTDSWATPPDRVIATVTDLHSHTEIILGNANIISKSRYQFTTSSLPVGQYSVRFYIVKGMIIDISDPLVQVILPDGGAQPVPAISWYSVLGLVVIMLGLAVLRLRRSTRAT